MIYHSHKGRARGSDVIHDWALAGRGLAQKALWDVEADLAAGRLVAVLEQQFCMELCLYITYPPAAHLPARTRLVIDHIAHALSQIHTCEY